MESIGIYSTIGLFLAAIFYFLSGGEQEYSNTFTQPKNMAVHRIVHKKRIVNGTGLGSLKIRTPEGIIGINGAIPVKISRAGSKHAIHCNVEVESTGENQSRITTDCTQEAKDNNPMKGVSEQAFSVVVHEHVAAAVELRPYDVDMVADKMLGLVQSNIFTIAKSSNFTPPD